MRANFFLALFLLNISIYAPLPPLPATEVLRVELIRQLETQLNFPITELLDQYKKAHFDFPKASDEYQPFTLGFFFTTEALWAIEKLHIEKLHLEAILDWYKTVHSTIPSEIKKLETIEKEWKKGELILTKEEISAFKKKYITLKISGKMTKLEYSTFKACLYSKNALNEDAPLKKMMIEIALDGMNIIYNLKAGASQNKVDPFEELKTKYQGVLAYLQTLLTPIKPSTSEVAVRPVSARPPKPPSLKRGRPLSPTFKQSKIPNLA